MQHSWIWIHSSKLVSMVKHPSCFFEMVWLCTCFVLVFSCKHMFHFCKGCYTLHDFCSNFPPIYSLEVLTLVGQRVSLQILTDFIENCIVYDGHRHRPSQTFFPSDFDWTQLNDIKHVWYFDLILEHIVFIFTRLFVSLLWSEQL